MLRKEHLWRMYLCSFGNTGNNLTCPFCNSDLGRKRDVEHLAQIRKRAEANDPGAINELANYYLHREEVHSRITRMQWNCALGQRNLVPVRRIIT